MKRFNNEIIFYTTLLVIAIMQIIFIIDVYVAYFIIEILPMYSIGEFDYIDISVSWFSGRVKLSLYYDADYIDYSNPYLLTVLV